MQGPSQTRLVCGHAPSTHTGIQINSHLLFAVVAVSYRAVLKMFSLLLLIAETELVTISSDVWLFKNSTELDDTSQKCE